MIEKTTAILIQQRALAAVRELMTILSEIAGKCSEEDYDRIKRGVGLSVGRVQMEILEVINAQHPEIDDLRSESDQGETGHLKNLDERRGNGAGPDVERMLKGQES